MIEPIKTVKGTIWTLDASCVRDLHDLLSRNYHLVGEMDPVEPAGVKNENMLKSAVDRQLVGWDDWYKYDNIYSNCSTLMFGVVKNHPFHNGNKRTAFLCMLKHLYVNAYVIKPEIGHKVIYEFIVAIADNSLESFGRLNAKKIYRQVKKDKKNEWTDEDKISFMEKWIQQNSVSKNRIIKHRIKISTLKKFLNSKRIFLEQTGTFIKTHQEEKRKIVGGLLTVGKKRINEKKYGVGASMTDVNKKVIANIRKDYNLTLGDGVDNVAFYDDKSFLDEEMLIYKKLIYRLSKT